MVLYAEEIVLRLTQESGIAIKRLAGKQTGSGSFLRAVIADTGKQAGRVRPYDAAFLSGSQSDPLMLTQTALENGASVIVLCRSRCPDGTFGRIEALCEERCVPLYAAEDEGSFDTAVKFFREAVRTSERERVRLGRELQEMLTDGGRSFCCPCARRRYGGFEDMPFRVAALRFVPRDPCAYDAGVMAQMERFAAVGAAGVTPDAETAYVGSCVTLIFDGVSPQDCVRAANAALTAIPRTLAARFDVYVGIGRECRGAGGIRESFATALKAADWQSARGRREKALLYDEMGLSRLLLELGGDNAAVNGFYRETVGRLLERDRCGGEELVPFLRTYFQFGGCRKSIGEALFFHRNTVNYKVARIKAETGRKLSDPEQMTELLVGLYLYDLFYREEGK